MSHVKELLLQVQREMLENERFKSLIVYYDVDPV
ncbi:Primosomal protein N' [termite gut metagenome]|uniref:Primosomal protein N n=1 Tax=termite gut metagenome TaxID=433724 RepID=A0A5J4RZB6_9ZZZZ